MNYQILINQIEKEISIKPYEIITKDATENFILN